VRFACGRCQNHFKCRVTRPETGQHASQKVTKDLRNQMFLGDGERAALPSDAYFSHERQCDLVGQIAGAENDRQPAQFIARARRIENSQLPIGAEREYLPAARAPR